MDWHVRETNSLLSFHFGANPWTKGGKQGPKISISFGVWHVSSMISDKHGTKHDTSFMIRQHS